jgi:hypothetical protein
VTHGCEGACAASTVAGVTHVTSKERTMQTTTTPKPETTIDADGLDLGNHCEASS